MEKILHGLPRAVVYIDDLLITGQDEQEHLHVLEQVLKCLDKYGVRLKCEFMQSFIDSLGYPIDKKGLHAGMLENPERSGTEWNGTGSN